MPATALEKACSSKMSKAIEFLKQEFRGVRTGRAHPGLIEHIKIEVASYGSTMELRELATISVPDPSTLLVKPFATGPVSHACLSTGSVLPSLTIKHRRQLSYGGRSAWAGEGRGRLMRLWSAFASTLRRGP